MWYVVFVFYSGVDASEALRLPGVKTFVGVDDVTGRNATGPVIFDEEVFASEKVDIKMRFGSSLQSKALK